MPKRATVGIDIGGTKTLFALFDEKFGLIEEIKEKTRATKGEKNFSAMLADALGALVKTAKKKDLAILAVGVGCTGTVDTKTGEVKKSPHIPFLEKYPLKSRLNKLASANVRIVNDVQAGLYGEHQLGIAKGLRHVIGIFIGTGIGGAIIIDGHLHLGAKGHAGNIGHYSTHSPPAGEIPGNSILNEVVSRPAIAAEAAMLASRHQAPNFLKNVGTDVSKITSADLALAIAQGDKNIEQVIRNRSRLVGNALSNIVDFLNPEMIVLGGGLVEAMPALIRQEVEAGVKATSTKEAFDGLEIAVAKLGNHAVTTGAAKLASDVALN